MTRNITSSKSLFADVSAVVGTMATALATCAGLAVVTTAPTACGPACRSAEVFSLEFECDRTSSFTGEVHLDSPASFDTFLRQECNPAFTDDEVLALITTADFSNNAVFVAVGPNALDNTRCLQSRGLDNVEVCTDGLKVTFNDVFATSDTACPPTRWTVAFSILRDDLRAALDAAESL